MKIRDGYKLSELGEIPQDWNIKNMGDVFNISGGIPIPRSQTVNDGVYYLHYGDIHKRNKKCININEDVIWLSKIDKDLLKGDSQDNLNTGDIVFVDASEDYEGTGKYIVVCNDGIVPFVAGLHTIVAREISKTLNDNYKCYCFSLSNVKKQFEIIATGSTVYGISQANIKGLKFIVPPIKEQQKIGEILSSNDVLIAKTDALIEKVKEIKQGLMQELLTHGIDHTEFKDSEFGRIPKEWKFKRLFEISDKIGDGLHGTPIYSEDGEYFFINGNNLKNGKIILFNETKRVNISEYKKYEKELDNRTILISINGTISNLALYNFEKVVLSKSAGYINISNYVNKKYIYYFLQSKNTQLFFLKELTGTTINNLSLDTLRKTPIALPDIGEQTQIVLVLSEIDKKIQCLRKRKQQLEEIKAGLMQDLLTGKVRVT